MNDKVDVVGWLGGNGLHTYEHEATGAPFALMTVVQHEQIVAALSHQEDSSAVPPAQDEREAFIAAARHHKIEGSGFNLDATSSGAFRDNETRMLYEGWKLARATRPAQKVNNVDTPEQQPIYQIRVRGNREWSDVHADGYRISLENPTLQTRIVYAAPIAQTDRDTKAAAIAELEGQRDALKAAMERLATVPGCGCSFPCRCGGEEWTRAELEGRMDYAGEALAALQGEQP